MPWLHQAALLIATARIASVYNKLDCVLSLGVTTEGRDFFARAFQRTLMTSCKMLRALYNIDGVLKIMMSWHIALTVMACYSPALKTRLRSCRLGVALHCPARVRASLWRKNECVLGWKCAGGV